MAPTLVMDHTHFSTALSPPTKNPTSHHCFHIASSFATFCVLACGKVSEIHTFYRLSVSSLQARLLSSSTIITSIISLFSQTCTRNFQGACQKIYVQKYESFCSVYPLCVLFARSRDLLLVIESLLSSIPQNDVFYDFS